jgi:hypothetical protein
MSANQYTKKPNRTTLSKADFENAGYSKADAARLANDTATNWKASNGGKRKP